MKIAERLKLAEEERAAADAAAQKAIKGLEAEVAHIANEFFVETGIKIKDIRFVEVTFDDPSKSFLQASVTTELEA